MTDYLDKLERDLKQMQERPTYKNTMQQVWKDKDILLTAIDTILSVFRLLVAEHEENQCWDIDACGFDCGTCTWCKAQAALAALEKDGE